MREFALLRLTTRSVCGEQFRTRTVVLILKYGDRLSYVSMVASFASFGTLETNRNVPEVPLWLPRSAGEPPRSAASQCIDSLRSYRAARACSR